MKKPKPTGGKQALLSRVKDLYKKKSYPISPSMSITSKLRDKSSGNVTPLGTKFYNASGDRMGRVSIGAKAKRKVK